MEEVLPHDVATSPYNRVTACSRGGPPGIRQMELWDVHPEEIEGDCVEFRPFVRFCKFPNRSHVHESDCGVQSAVSRGLISTMRYESYRKLTLGDGE